MLSVSMSGILELMWHFNTKSAQEWHRKPEFWTAKVPQMASRNKLVKSLEPQWHQAQISKSMAQSHGGIGGKTHQTPKCHINSHGFPRMSRSCLYISSSWHFTPLSQIFNYVDCICHYQVICWPPTPGFTTA